MFSLKRNVCLTCDSVEIEDEAVAAVIIYLRGDTGTEGFCLHTNNVVV